MENMLGFAIALIGAGLAVGFACAGSGKGTGIAGEAAAGLCAVEPKKFGKSMILQVLPGTQGLYGLVAWFLVASKIGVLSGSPAELTVAQGVMVVGACLPVVVGEYITAIHQGRTAAAAMKILAQKPNDWSKGILLCVMVEFYAILCLLATFLMVNGLPL